MPAFLCNKNHVLRFLTDIFVSQSTPKKKMAVFQRSSARQFSTGTLTDITRTVMRWGLEHSVGSQCEERSLQVNV